MRSITCEGRRSGLTSSFFTTPIGAPARRIGRASAAALAERIMRGVVAAAVNRAVRHVATVTAAVVTIALSGAPVFAGASAPTPEVLAAREAAREAARQQAAASGHVSKSFTVDGTPRRVGPTADQKRRIDATLRPHIEGELRNPRIHAGDATRGDAGIRLLPEDPAAGPMRSLSTIIGEAGMASDIGGDDVFIAQDPDYTAKAFLSVTSTGDYFAAVSNWSQVDVFKSTDGGESWTLWSTFAPGVGLFWVPAMTVAEGASDRIFIAYPAFGELRVAWADITAPVPTWTVVTAMVDVGVSHGTSLQLDIYTDAGPFLGYFVYVVSRGSDGNGDDIWFTRSINQGTSYDAAYRIADSGTSAYDFFITPSVVFGHDNWIHVAYSSQDTSGTVHNDVSYRRVPLWGNGGLVNWEAEQLVKPGDNFDYILPQSIAASQVDGTVAISGLQFGLGPVHGRMRYSSDHGTTFPGANDVATGLANGFTRPVILGSGEVIMGAHNAFVTPPNTQIEIARSSTADLSTWTAPQELSDHLWNTGVLSGLHGLAVDPTRGNQAAVVWLQSLTSVEGGEILRFDAEWRRDPGYANTEAGFPWSIPGGRGQTTPAIAEIDGDPQSEIVFATLTGDIHVLNHDGTEVPGWPVNIGPWIAGDVGVAVGNLTGNDDPYIVAGNLSGQVFAFDASGSLRPGWPVQMTETAPVYVSIGALGPPYARYVVALCGHEMRVLRYDGVNLAPAWGTFTDLLTRPAAIGDIDNDGTGEIVTLKGSWFHTHRLGLNTSINFRNFPGEVFTDAPTLADVDNDGDLEIAAPTSIGRMYLLNHDGSDYSMDWPVTVPSGSPLTSAAFAHILGTSEPELIFAERNGTGLAHIFFTDGTEQAAYPRAFGDVLYTPPIVDKTDIWPGNVILATPTTSTGYTWGNLGHDAPGWPRNMPGIVEETPASGDIDLDGRNEVVFVGYDFVTVFDVGVAPGSDPRTRWPMYGHDAQRTGCFDCDEVLTGVGDVPGLTEARALHLDVYPNPLNPVTTVTYEVTRPGPVTLVLYDVTGRVVDRIIEGEYRDANRYAVSYEPRAASGVYFLRLESGGEVVTRKISLLK